MEKIREFQDEYRWLSNFYPCLITYNGNLFTSVEHAYCSMKSEDDGWLETCMNVDVTPGKLKRLSRDITLRSDWDSIKESVMKECLNLKFSQEPLKGKLIDTNPMIIEEGNNWGDVYWGVSLETGEGQNKLGRILMQIRTKLIINK
jgi:ribA/ribD-fused uncharacterized protein